MYFENVDYTDSGVAGVQLRVKSQAAATVELHAESPTGGDARRCMVPSTSNAWASQTCTLAQTATGMARLYVVAGGAMHLNWLKFVPGTISTGAGGAGGGAGGAAGGASGGAGGSAAGGGGGNAGGGAGGSANGGSGRGAGGGANGGAGGGANGGTGGGVNGGTGGNSNGGSGGGGNSGAGGTTSGAGGGEGPGCSCQVGNARGPSATLLVIGLVAVVFCLRRGRARRASRSAPQARCATLFFR